MTHFQIYILSALVLCAVPGCVFWYQAKFLLRSRGFPVSFFTRGRHMQDLFFMKELQHSVRDPLERVKLGRMRSCMILFMTATLVLLLTFVVDLLISLLSLP